MSIWRDLDPTATPEYFAACRVGYEAEERMLVDFLRKVEREGDEVDRFFVLYRFFEMYDHHHDHVRVLQTLEKMDELPCTAPYIYRYIAEALAGRYGECELALKYLKREAELLTVDYQTSFEYGELLRLKRLQLFILANDQPGSETTRHVLGELHWLTTGSTVYDEFLLPALERMVQAGSTSGDTRVLLQVLWADMMRRRKFQSWENTDVIERIESLIERLPPDPPDTEEERDRSTRRRDR